MLRRSKLRPDMYFKDIHNARRHVTGKPSVDKGGPVHLYSDKGSANKFYHRRGLNVEYQQSKKFFGKLWGNAWCRQIINLSLATVVLGAGFSYWYQNFLLTQAMLIPRKRKTHRSRLTVVFDLDETLISYGDKAYRMRGGLVPRPYLVELLDYLTEIDAEVVVWAAASERYMLQVLEAIDPTQSRVQYYVPRDKRWFATNGYYEKNVRWLGRDMNDVIIIENRTASVRGCNNNALLVQDFIRGEYMDTGRDWPPNDHALLDVKKVVQGLEETGLPVQTYLNDAKARSEVVKQIPCHLAMKQLPDEMAVGNFFFVGDKYLPGTY